MTGWSEDPAVASALLPGRPDDYIGTVVMDGGLLAPLEERAGILSLLGDNVPLPRAEARDNHSDERHLEYWLSGLRDARAVLRELGLTTSAQSVLGLERTGCGRVMRHLARDLPGARLFFGAPDAAHVHVVNAMFEGRVRGFRTGAFPHLPFANASLDGVFAIETLPNTLEACAWLLEFKRVLKPDGKAYATLQDAEAWSTLSEDGAEPPPSEASGVGHHVPREMRHALHTDPAGSPFLAGSQVLSVWAKIMRIAVIKPRAKHGEIGVVLCA